MGGGKGKAPPPPDYGPLIAASQQQAQYSYELGKRQQDWAEKTYAENKEITDQFVDFALGQMDRQAEWSAADRERYETIFQPLEEQLAYEAETYASPERQEYEAGKAEADVAQQFEQARRTAQERLEAFGVDPTQTRAGALDLQTRVAEAAAQSASGNQARERVENTGRALRSEAINVGKGYPAQALAAAGAAQGAGQGGVSAGLAQTASGANTMGTGMGWQGMGNQSLGQWGQFLHQGFQDQLSSWKANQEQSSGWGSALGLVGGIASKFLPFAEGGIVPEYFQEGGMPGGGGPVPAEASPSGGAMQDDVPAVVDGRGPAQLSSGEFVIPEDVMKWKGEEWAQKEILKARKAMEGVNGERPAVPEVGPPPPMPPDMGVIPMQ